MVALCISKSLIEYAIFGAAFNLVTPCRTLFFFFFFFFFFEILAASTYGQGPCGPGPSGPGPYGIWP